MYLFLPGIFGERALSFAIDSTGDRIMKTHASTLVAVSRYTLLRARQEIIGCESCTEQALVPFSWVLDRVTDTVGPGTDYIMSESVRCPRCTRSVYETTLIEWG
jgi:hypothetical protein